MRRWIVWSAALCGLWWGPSALSGGSGQNPLERAAWAPEVIEGTIREVLVVGHYSYLRVERGAQQGDAWVVVMNEPHASGEVVTARVYASLASFRSERLGRVFDKVYFGAVGGPARWTR